MTATSSSSPDGDDDYSCRELVEVVTDYLDGAVSSRDRSRIEAHLRICEGCERYLDQIREVIRLSGRLREQDLEAMAPEARQELLVAFRAARASQTP